MPSQLAWLDTSAEEQRRVRELIRLYSHSESRDELGIGQIRDVFSESLFPGTSVLQTRARYFLFVPWSFRAGADRRRGPQLKAWAEHEERQLISTFKSVPELQNGQGFIGSVAGVRLQNLPSTLYWPALVKYGILTSDRSPDQLGGPALADHEEELAERRVGDWHPTLPPAPAEFPKEVPGAFDLTADEAGWLQERMLSATDGTLLSHLLSSAVPLEAAPEQGGDFAWNDALCKSATGEPAAWLHHAHLFSVSLHGAALLYNLLVGETYLKEGLGDGEWDPVEELRERLDLWAGVCTSLQDQLTQWDQTDLWLRVQSTNPRINQFTKSFVTTWLTGVVSGAARKAADDSALRDAVQRAERRQKGRQSRFENKRLLANWKGEAGTGQLGYRWPNVRRIVTDVHEGIARAHA